MNSFFPSLPLFLSLATTYLKSSPVQKHSFCGMFPTVLKSLDFRWIGLCVFTFYCFSDLIWSVYYKTVLPVGLGQRWHKSTFADGGRAGSASASGVSELKVSSKQNSETGDWHCSLFCYSSLPACCPRRVKVGKIFTGPHLSSWLGCDCQVFKGEIRHEISG